MVVIQSSDPIHASEQIEGVHENKAFAMQLRAIADLLEEQKANEFRVRAYRSAAETLDHLSVPVRDVFDREGADGLIRLPKIGHSIASLLESAIRVGRIPLLDRLRGQSNAEHYFATLPGIGPQLSHRIYEQLHIETMAELKQAASDGRLLQVPGLGRRRIEAIQGCLERHGVSPHDDSQNRVTTEAISVDELLDIDREYRRRAEAGDLEKIKPSQGSASQTDWLPVMHTDRQGRHYTAMFSTTVHAQEQHATHDWVIVFRDDANAHGRWTIITSQFGKLKGLRIVRSREDECQSYYRQHNAVRVREAGHAPHPELPSSWDEDEGRRGVHG
ncbi:hypothetical protein Poly51_38510 [Rubripirellula tenax]|uniref:Crossover junction endonuclease MUS81-like HHH domain-containing protein n=1 Tax=Rubripirellula tenax TaxID=2528015 RepID=A0A5C6ESX9_9BACT|nr:helix-hairpin-helix domain-containing protein [Rubripirellula tenax]TWU50559.1 hypothetical protein Poly51_38510 [Rubripirellula tenax]